MQGQRPAATKIHRRNRTAPPRHVTSPWRSHGVDAIDDDQDQTMDPGHKCLDSVASFFIFLKNIVNSRGRLCTEILGFYL